MKVWMLLYFLIIAQTASSQSSISLVDGNTYYIKKEFTKAIEIYNKDLQSGSGNPAILHNLALAYFKADNSKKAIECLEKVIPMMKGKNILADAHYNLGVIFVKENQLLKALNAFKTALYLKPSIRVYKENLQLLINDLKRKQSQGTEAKTKNGQESSAKATSSKHPDNNVENKSTRAGEKMLDELQQQESARKISLHNDKQKKASATILDW